MLSNSTPISIGPVALEKQPYDPVEGFTHIALIGSAPCVVMANPTTGLKTFADLEAMARKSGRLDFGSGGPASIGHIYGELMKSALGLNMVRTSMPIGITPATDVPSVVEAGHREAGPGQFLRRVRTAPDARRNRRPAQRGLQ
ncbi:MAG: tripartite tricarboxylate transporter substrate-binding protein [Pseudomonadota bacterium]|nr:tripartite tricarboxylate transporter substrate-binding protein [Pseudomonadota bacterium]